ncbi:MAG: shikimate kinase [Flavobacteriales bacterium]|nr:shikimate kinase [Flavobacteriales bacterium]|tara:strand:+ start:840 stop:1358 length:519 start_codon:yes stop_codon:yes gene_type:complete
MKFDKIFLIGFMGCGKSTLGKKLAKQLGWNFIDLDAFIEKKEGKSISVIFKDHGEDYFRNLETKTLNQLSERSFYIVSCGGGTPCFNNNIEIINQLGMSVYIKLSTDTLYERLKSEKMNRPLIANLTDSKMKLFIDKTLKQRAVFYEKAIEIFNSELQSEEKFVKRLNDFIV